MRVQNPGSNISFFSDYKLNSGSIELTKIRVSGSYVGMIHAIKKRILGERRRVCQFHIFIF